MANSLEKVSPPTNIDKTFDKGFEILDWVHDEAGLVAVILTVVCMYLIWSLWAERRENRNTTDKLYNLGVETTKAMTQAASNLEKVYQLLSIKKEP